MPSHITVACETCGTSLQRKISALKNHAFCSHPCYNEWQSKFQTGPKNPAWKGGNVEISCAECGESKFITRSHFEKSERHFCDTTCSSRWQVKNVDRKGKKSSGWAGGKRVCRDGYVHVHVAALDEKDRKLAEPMLNRRYVSEHRLVIARRFGRPLKSSEQVHHRNGDRSDNRLSNLELQTRPGHLKKHLEQTAIIHALRRRVETLEAEIGR